MQRAMTLLVLISILLLGCREPVERQLEDRLDRAEAKIQRYEELEAKRVENDTIILLSDGNGFIGRGIVALGSDAKIHETFKFVDAQGRSQPEEYLYKLEEPRLLDRATGTWFKLDVQRGETVFLISYNVVSKGGFVAYYTCYTNSSQCMVRTKVTTIRIP